MHVRLHHIQLSCIYPAPLTSQRVSQSVSSRRKWAGQTDEHDSLEPAGNVSAAIGTRTYVSSLSEANMPIRQLGQGKAQHTPSPDTVTADGMTATRLVNPSICVSCF